MNWVKEGADNIIKSRNRKVIWLTEPQFYESVSDPAKFEWHEVKKVSHYYLSVDSIAQPMMVRDDSAPYGKEKLWRPYFFFLQIVGKPISAHPEIP